MLRINPEERLSLGEIVASCESENKKPKIDPYLIMDDIIEKLKLLNYERDFCLKKRKPQINRIYFSHDKPLGSDDERFEMFFDLVYWLMSLHGGRR